MPLLTQAENDRLTRVNSGSPIATLMRQFWQPVAISADVAEGAAKSVRVFGDVFTLYRGESGQAYFVDGRCAHRCTVLDTGWVQDEQIRCMYHGWRYDGSGQCTEMPAERHLKPEQVKIGAYPVHEYAGLVFVYLGAGPAPAFDLPRKHFLEDPNFVLSTYADVWDCNWLQQIENAFDAVHVSFVHQWGAVGRFGEEITSTIPELSYEETTAGLRQIATRENNNVRIGDWVFPNNNHIVLPGPRKGDPWFHLLVWVVPIDDDATLRLHVLAHAREADLSEPGFLYTTYAADYYKQLFEKHQFPDVPALDSVALQDYVAIRGQGEILDRTRERLGSSDIGIALLRRTYQRELDALRDGKPLKSWQRLVEDVKMPTPASPPDSSLRGLAVKG